MSLISIITVNEYKTRFPSTALDNIRDARVQSAINLSFSYLDVKCGCAISSRWNIVSPTVGYLTDEQKNYVKEAMYVETQYILANNLDFSQGADQTSFGSLSVSSSRPERKEICESALMYLQKAGLYDYLSFSSPTYAGNGCFSQVSCGEIDPTEVFITETTADLRYVHKAQGVDQAGKFLYVDTNGNVGLTNAGLDPDNYYTSTVIDNKLLPLQQKVTQLNLGYLKSISRNVPDKTITVTDDVGDITTFPYGGGSTVVPSSTEVAGASEMRNLKIDDTNWKVVATLPTNAVTIDTTQTITGEKTFDTNPYIAGIKTTDGTNTYTATLQNKTGTIALTSDVEASGTEVAGATPLKNLKVNNVDWVIPEGTTYQAGTNITIDATTTPYTISASDVVTTDTEQTITGKKTFNRMLTTTVAGGYKIDFGSSADSYAYANGQFLRYNPDSTIKYQIAWPSATGTLALTSDIPTTTSDLTNDSGFITNSVNDLTNYYTKTNTDTLLNSYLPLAGGLMNGTTYISYNAKDKTIAGYYDDMQITLCGGTSAVNGGSITLYGKSHSDAGQFRIGASNATIDKYLIGKPDGTLTWNSKDIITSAGGNMSGNFNYTNTASTIGVTCTNTDNRLAFYSGPNYQGGAYLELQGKDSTQGGSYANNFILAASNGTPVTLIGKADGTLTWNSKNVATNGWTNLTYTAGTNVNWNSLSQLVYNENMIFISGVDVKCSTATTGNLSIATITIPSGYATITDQVSFVWSTLDGTQQGVGFKTGNTLMVYTGSATLAANTAIRFQCIIPLKKS